jgi:hypothetical protein
VEKIGVSITDGRRIVATTAGHRIAGRKGYKRKIVVPKNAREGTNAGKTAAPKNGRITGARKIGPRLSHRTMEGTTTVTELPPR